MNRLISLFLFLSFVCSGLAQQANISQISKDVEYLSSPELEGRETGTLGADLALEYIKTRMEEIGLQAAPNADSFTQEFSLEKPSNPHGGVDSNASPVIVKNIVGYLDNEAENTVVIGAHYDHLGYGEAGSLYAGEEKMIHFGADDNASGVGLMLQLAERMKSSEKMDEFNFLFIGFSGEEQGLWGSNYFCKNPSIEMENVSFMINMDMVGRLELKRGLAINGVGTSPSWESILNESNTDQLKLVTSESGVGPSDHTSFYLQEIPVLHFFTGQHEDYHKPSDVFDKINFEGIDLIGDFIFSIIANSQELGKLEFTKTKQDSSETPRFTVTLGVMPDYLFQGEGMRIDGVSENKPAKKAGFEKGDVVVKMGKTEVTDMMSYMKALSLYKKGDKVKVTVLRGSESISKKVIF